MAAITNATTATVVTHHIPPEAIERAVDFAVQRPYVWMELTHSPDLTTANTATYSHPIISQLGAATAHTETDEVSSSEIARVNATITTAEYALATFLGDRARRLSVAPEDLIAVDRLVDGCQQKIEADVLALASSMTNTQGNATTVNDVVNFNSVLAAFRAQIGSANSRPVMCMSTAAIRDLHEDASTNAAAIYGSLIGVQLHDATGGVNQGLRRPFGNIDMVETAGVVAGDTTGKANFITLVGGPVATALMVPIGKDIMVEGGRVAERIGDWLVASFEHGAGIVDQNRCRRFITRA